MGLIILAINVFGSEAHGFMFCAVDVPCCTKTIKNTSVTCTVARGDVFLHYDEHGCCDVVL